MLACATTSNVQVLRRGMLSTCAVSITQPLSVSLFSVKCLRRKEMQRMHRKEGGWMDSDRNQTKRKSKYSPPVYQTRAHHQPPPAYPPRKHPRSSQRWPLGTTQISGRDRSPVCRNQHQHQHARPVPQSAADRGKSRSIQVWRGDMRALLNLHHCLNDSLVVDFEICRKFNREDGFDCFP
jgi:hypothetical protein